MSADSVHRVDFLPWEYDPHSADGAAQAERLRELAASGAVIGDRVFVSASAAVFCDRLSIGDRSYIAANAYVTDNVAIGADCSVNPFAVVRGDVQMGDGVRIGAHTSILGFNHEMEPDAPVFTQGLSSRGIVLGDDVWIGSQVTILDGVVVGDHVVIGAGSVVTKSVPDHAVVAGNPARVLRDRRAPAREAGLREGLRRFGDTARAEITAVLARCFEGGRFVDCPGTAAAPTLRPWADAVELADLLLDAPPPGFDAADLLRRLTARQDPATGLVADGDLSDAGLERAQTSPDPQSSERLSAFEGPASYHVLSASYAVRLLGGRMPHPIRAVHGLTGTDVTAALDARDWAAGAWGSGAAVDAVATACAANMLDHSDALDDRGVGPLLTVLGWAVARADPRTGLWGEELPDGESPRLQAVNGFYRLTRGLFAQFGLPLPYPVATIDTVLLHAADPHLSTPDGWTACNVLDIAHPLWLASQQTQHRRGEIAEWARGALEQALGQWVPGEGMAFAPRSSGEDGEPGLQGTEMWLSIIWLLADLLHASDSLGYRMRGVHRPEPIATLRPASRS
ncbi:acetyltransferase [Pseudoclavibacter sp. RFBJ3]|uniref:acyltransferase n=1 Tax=unclassified Pseudoclavibacter TaxID=2615177 RepID=UPI000CE8249D|nr:MULTISPECIES: acyltransferase [unclassified Pseudoclavibacter]PPF84311.1 acetyltransferase [Pseudoclavibacter sp. RFBJ5]PPF92789.1 acetyltransferase [Pseudoclavibacter sp. RFBJ3]PPF98139.1 acetyltransferase [Pseudoclavibacter sp. RFBH5]PPG25209.1 acetyltransferase [Pseudoclavibacter sp. RFBI4]